MPAEWDGERQVRAARKLTEMDGMTGRVTRRSPTLCCRYTDHRSPPSRVMRLGGEDKWLKVPVTLRRENPKFNVLKAELGEKRVERPDWIWRHSHHLPAQTPFQVCPDVVHPLINGIERRHPSRKREGLWKLVNRQMNHYGSAHIEHSEELTKVRVTNVDAVQVLENMGRKDTLNGAITLRQMQAVNDRKLHILTIYRFSGATEHSFRDIHSVDVVKRPCHCFRNAARTTSDFQAALCVDSILPPVTPEVLPVRFSKSVELSLGPRRSPPLVLVRPSSYGDRKSTS